MQRVRHANRGRLLLRTPGPVPLWDLHVFLCRDQSLLNLSCLRTFEFRTPLGTSLLLGSVPHCGTCLNWMSRKKKLTMNLKKTQCMLIGTSQKLSKCRNLCVEVGDVLIENLKCAKLLVVNIDECLSWSVYSDVLCKKLQQKIGVYGV